MGNILGFGVVHIAKCAKCDATFSYEDKDAEIMNINNKRKIFVACPNCGDYVTEDSQFGLHITKNKRVLVWRYGENEDN